jgi:hypothetical protein
MPGLHAGVSPNGMDILPPTFSFPTIPPSLSLPPSLPASLYAQVAAVWRREPGATGHLPGPLLAALHRGLLLRAAKPRKPRGPRAGRAPGRVVFGGRQALRAAAVPPLPPRRYLAAVQVCACMSVFYVHVCVCFMCMCACVCVPRAEHCILLFPSLILSHPPASSSPGTLSNRCPWQWTALDPTSCLPPSRSRLPCLR